MKNVHTTQEIAYNTCLSESSETTRVTHHQVPIDDDDDCMLGGAVISAWVKYYPSSIGRRGETTVS